VPVPPPRPHTTPITIDTLAMEFGVVRMRFIAAASLRAVLLLQRRSTTPAERPGGVYCSSASLTRPLGQCRRRVHDDFAGTVPCAAGLAAKAVRLPRPILLPSFVGLQAEDDGFVRSAKDTASHCCGEQECRQHPERWPHCGLLR
jgi:hypothetical protein